ncbi:MAG TPA: 3-oxoadipate enol-lactonase [Streptosporangiaceae bacterium]|nr:3-oxoadipate enol-lactonase [Streptosporangiaceae bacterium]
MSSGGVLPLDFARTGPADAPVLVLGNSLGTTRRVWEPQAPVFAERYGLLRYELPGHSLAAAPPAPYALDDLGYGVLGLLDSLGIEQASYCGISLGGMIGMWLAAHAPERIDRLALVCTSAFLPPASGWRARADLVEREGMAAVVNQSIGRWFTPEFTAGAPGLVASFADDLAAVIPDGYAGCCRAIALMDLRPCLGSISAPTLVVSGERDPATPPEHGALIAEAIPGARHLVIPGTSHLANVGAPGAVTGVLLEHLRR